MLSVPAHKSSLKDNLADTPRGSEMRLTSRAPAGFNCAEAVNFGPPDWLPWGTYVANKYRREGRSATLSHDALLIALVTAAPDVQKRLEREAKVCHVTKLWSFSHALLQIKEQSCPYHNKKLQRYFKRVK